VDITRVQRLENRQMRPVGLWETYPQRKKRGLVRSTSRNRSCIKKGMTTQTSSRRLWTQSPGPSPRMLHACDPRPSSPVGQQNLRRGQVEHPSRIASRRENLPPATKTPTLAVRACDPSAFAPLPPVTDGGAQAASRIVHGRPRGPGLRVRIQHLRATEDGGALPDAGSPPCVCGRPNW
jgi:hypothetical protein